MSDTLEKNHAAGDDGSDETALMRSVRIAGLVGSREAPSVKNAASLMEVAAWIHRVAGAAPGAGPDVP